MSLTVDHKVDEDLHTMTSAFLGTRESHMEPGDTPYGRQDLSQRVCSTGIALESGCAWFKNHMPRYPIARSVRTYSLRGSVALAISFRGRIGSSSTPRNLGGEPYR